ncbi:hypothetical protein SAMN02745900_03866 [Pseudomonas sp. URIL14HWK12:I8]|uniref:DUF6731 family protein n=1 Tax=unclassified Pseudomonas TaxID=196821 RepID=UPI000489C878|nr:MULTISPECIES: DUF6731 family protein [unclassified Pseudomonas]SNB81544.1 hypothetical protein SAMN02745900_03866 [Pseudomonas sp. URIL14HWK12:I8]
MTDRMRKYAIDFFTGQIGPVNSKEKLSAFLRKLSGKVCPHVEGVTYDIEIRGLVEAEPGVFQGVFAKIRKDELPHAGKAGHPDRDLGLAQDEGLVDKNHFVYYEQNELLVMQANRYAGTAVALGKYLTDIHGQLAVSFNPVLQPDATRRLMREDLTPVQIETSFARPTNPDLYPDDDWSTGLLDMLSQLGGGNVKLSVTADRKRVAEGADRLTDRARRVAQAFRQIPNVRKVKINMEDDEGIIYPIDLIADRLKVRIEISVSGRYPNEAGMFKALKGAKNDQLDNLQQIFGIPGANLN